MALVSLRGLRSLRVSSTYALGFGVVTDATHSSKRESMLDPINLATNLGTDIGPILGGIVARTNGSPEWAFWTLVLVAVILFLRETARNLNGDGSDTSRYKWWQSSGLQLLKHNSNQPSLSMHSHPRTHHQYELTASIDGTSNSSPLPKPVLTTLHVFIHKHAPPNIVHICFHQNALEIGASYLSRTGSCGEWGGVWGGGGSGVGGGGGD